MKKFTVTVTSCRRFEVSGVNERDALEEFIREYWLGPGGSATVESLGDGPTTYSIEEAKE